MAAVIGLLSLIDNAAANALFSLAVAGNSLARLTPILARLIWGRERFLSGDFYTGKYLSRPIGWIAVVYMLYVIVLTMVPTEGSHPSRKLGDFFFFFPEPSKILLTNRFCSGDYELHRCYQWVLVGWGIALLLCLCWTDFQGSADYY